MIGRQIVGGVAGLGAMSILAAGLIWSDHSRLRPSGQLSTLTLVERLNTARPVDRRWSVTHAVSFRRVMVVHVETRRFDDARDIAARIVDPVRALEYEEILIYFRSTSNRRASAQRRVQWTPHGGFVELLIGEPPVTRPEPD